MLFRIENQVGGISFRLKRKKIFAVPMPRFLAGSDRHKKIQF
jgi:hypothetical protein